MNVFEAVDVISLIRNGAYDDLGLTVGEALQKRSPVGLSSIPKLTFPTYRPYYYLCKAPIKLTDIFLQ